MLFGWGQALGGPRYPHPKSKTRRIGPLFFLKGPNYQKRKNKKKKKLFVSLRGPVPGLKGPIPRPEGAHPRLERAHLGPERVHPRFENAHFRVGKDHPVLKTGAF